MTYTYYLVTFGLQVKYFLIKHEYFSLGVRDILSQKPSLSNSPSWRQTHSLAVLGVYNDKINNVVFPNEVSSSALHPTINH